MDKAEGLFGLVRPGVRLASPLPRECVLCFVWRMVDAYGCNATGRWVRLWREARAPRATAVEHRLGRRPAFCDCELFVDNWDLRPLREAVRAGLPAARARAVACPGVRGGSAQPCGLWERHQPVR